MPIRANGFPARERFVSVGVPAHRVDENLDRKVPVDAEFQHIEAGYGDASRCDGCNAPIESDEVLFELEFRRGGEVFAVRLHVDCWETWRSDRLRSHNA
jgi:hypothetical protein